VAPPLAPQDSFADLTQLASRITQHLQQHPGDTQARDDLRYVTAKLGTSNQPGSAAAVADANDPENAVTNDPHPGWSIASGLASAAMDIPKGVATAVMHPVKTLGQVTGLGNLKHYADVLADPDASTAEAADAAFRATPTNVGYAPERALMQATGATGEPPASLEEQAHRAGNVASLALLGVKPGAVAKAVGGRLMGRLGSAVLDRFLPAGARSGAEAAEAAPAAPAAPESPPAMVGSMTEQAVRASLAKQGIAPEVIDRLVAENTVPTAPEPTVQPSRPPEPTPSAVAPTVPSEAPPTLEPIPGQPKDFTAVGRPTPPPPNAPTVTEFQDRLAGRSNLTLLGKGQTLPYYPRGGAAEQAMPPGPAESPPLPGSILTKAAAVKHLLGMSAQDFETAAPSLLPPELLEQVRAWRDAGKTPADVDAVMRDFGGYEAEPSGAGAAEAMQHPAYQNADVLARQAVRIAPEFAKLSVEQATVRLRSMILDYARTHGGQVPALTTLPKFLQRLRGP